MNRRPFFSPARAGFVLIFSMACLAGWMGRASEPSPGERASGTAEANTPEPTSVLEPIGADPKSPDRLDAAWRREQPAALGVSLAPGPWGVTIVDVIDSSPAAAADLKAGDLIVTLNGLRMREPNDIYWAMARLRPDDEVRLGIIRDHATARGDGRRSTTIVVVTLATWDEVYGPRREREPAFDRPPPVAPPQPVSDDDVLRAEVEHLRREVTRLRERLDAPLTGKPRAEHPVAIDDEKR